MEIPSTGSGRMGPWLSGLANRDFRILAALGMTGGWGSATPPMVNTAAGGIRESPLREAEGRSWMIGFGLG